MLHNDGQFHIKQPPHRPQLFAEQSWCVLKSQLWMKFIRHIQNIGLLRFSLIGVD